MMHLQIRAQALLLTGKVPETLPVDVAACGNGTTVFDRDCITEDDVRMLGYGSRLSWLSCPKCEQLLAAALASDSKLP